MNMKERHSENNKILERAKSIIERRLSDRNIKACSSSQAKDLASVKLSLYEEEVFALFLLDTQLHVIKYVELFKGTVDSCAVYPREIVKLCLNHNAKAVILMHNHPSGFPDPSSGDIELTNRVRKALGLIDTYVTDHIIVAGQLNYSFAENGLITGIKESITSIV